MWSGLSVTVIDPYEAGGGFGQLEILLRVLPKNWGDPRPCWCRAGDGKWERKGGKDRIIPYRTTSLLLPSVGTVLACTGREMVVSLPLGFLE